MTAPHRTAPGGRHLNGGRTLADRLDANAAALEAVADAVDSATLAHLEHNQHTAAEVAALRADVAGIAHAMTDLAAEVAAIRGTVTGTGMTLAGAVPPLLEAVTIVTDAANDGICRTWWRRRRAARLERRKARA